jgi:hypothetical protein
VIECAVLIPVLNRPEQVERVVLSLEESLVEADATPYFIANQDDTEEIAALQDLEVPYLTVGPRAPGDYARKINHAVRATREPWLFLGADDLKFAPGWLDVAIAVAEREGVGVVGTNDLGNPAVIRGQHSTHSLVSREYAVERGSIDQPRLLLHEGYDHQFVDNEFVETARHRGQFAFAQRAVVEHLHPHWGKAENDSTYEIAVASYRRDQEIFRRRRRLWRGGHPQTRHGRRVRTR